MPLDPKQLIRLSKLLSRMLRHEPAAFGLALDPEGYAPIKEVLAAVREHQPLTSLDDLRRVMTENDPDKRRFSIEGDCIRANYGHSIASRIKHESVEPPAQLLHGTYTKAVSVILKEGLQPMRRQYVHLTTNPELAARIGSRHGTHCLILVDAARAHGDGIRFYRANDAFWLADTVPARYLTPQF